MSAALILALQLGPALAGAVVALALDAFDRRVAAVVVSCAGLAASGGFGLYAGTTAAGSTVFEVLRVGAVFSTVPGVIMILAALALWGGWNEFIGRPGGGSSAALVALAAVASAAIAQSFDLLMLLVALETAAAAGYALVADARTARSDESALKYFVQGAIATGLLVMGLAVLVGGFAPTGAYLSLANVFTEPSLPTAALAGALLVLSALAFKSSLVPFHSWAPDAYESARPEVAAFLASGPKLGALGAMALFMAVVASGTLADRIIVVMAAVSGLSILVGSLGALRQRSYTRMLGYAGITQAGYALIGVVVLNPTSAVFFATTYAIATTGTFLAATAFRQARPEWDGSIDGLAGLGRGRARTAAISVTVLLVSLAGIPPLLGFWGKFQVFAGAITLSGRMFIVAGNPLLGWTYALLATAGIVGSVVSLAYYGSVLQALYLADQPTQQPETHSTNGDSGAETDGEESPTASVLVVTALAVVVLGLVPLFMGMSALMLPFTVG
jgi:NADH-quinone oxidoreductase subunit N